MNETKLLLSMWTIYDSPSDHPGKFVVREWFTGKGIIEPVSGDATVHDDIWAARGAIPEGLVPMARNMSDDPCIVETWI